MIVVFIFLLSKNFGHSLQGPLWFITVVISDQQTQTDLFFTVVSGTIQNEDLQNLADCFAAWGEDVLPLILLKICVWPWS